jgi:hypothetical protein
VVKVAEIVFKVSFDGSGIACGRGILSAPLGAGSSTAHCDSRCEPQCYAQDDSAKLGIIAALEALHYPKTRVSRQAATDAALSVPVSSWCE